MLEVDLHGFSFEVRAQTEMEIWCIEGMFMVKVVSTERNLGFKGPGFNLIHCKNKEPQSSCSQAVGQWLVHKANVCKGSCHDMQAGDSLTIRC